MEEAPRDYALSFEAVKISLRQTKEGWALVLAIHPNDAPEELFQTLIGSRYQVAMVLTDDENKPTSVVKPVVERDDRVQYAVMLCKEPLFQAWTADRWMGDPDNDEEATARTAILEECGIGSRAELRTNTDAQRAFDALVAEYRRDVGIK